jgi:hypothetical protein
LSHTPRNWYTFCGNQFGQYIWQLRSAQTFLPSNPTSRNSSCVCVCIYIYILIYVQNDMYARLFTIALFARAFSSLGKQLKGRPAQTHRNRNARRWGKGKRTIVSWI